MRSTGNTSALFGRERWLAAVAFAAGAAAFAADAAAQNVLSRGAGDTKSAQSALPLRETVKAVPTERRFAQSVPDGAAKPSLLSTAEKASRMKTALAAIEARAKAGQNAEALAMARQALQFAEAQFPKGHGYIGRAQQTVGDVLMRLGRPREAGPHYLAALVIASKFFSIEKPAYQGLVSRLTKAWLQTGLADKAVALYAHILKATDAAPERETLAHAIYRSQYGRLLRQRGRMRDAETQHRRSLAIRQRLLPAGDLQIAYALTDIGGVMRATGRFGEAERYFLAAVAIVKEVKGQEANLGILLDNLGTVYGELGRRADAERVQRRAVALFEGALGPDHLTTGVGYANLAALYYQQGRYVEARPLFDRALTLYRKLLPAKDIRIGVLLDNYAGLLRAQGQREEAAKLYSAALDALRANYPAQHPEIAKALSNLALAEQENGRVERAIALVREAIAMNEALLGKQHFALGVQYASLGDMYLGQKKPRAAIAALKHAITVFEATVGPHHDKAIIALRQLAGLSLGQQLYDDALRYIRQAVIAERLRVERNRLDPDASERVRDGSAFGGSVYIAWKVGQAQAQRADALGRIAFEDAQWVTLSRAGQSVTKIGARFAARNPAVAALARERQDLAQAWRVADARLVATIARPRDKHDPRAVAAAREELAQIDARLKVLDARLATEFPAFAALGQPKPIALADVQGLLKPNEALVHYVVHGADLFVWAVTRERFAWRRIERPYAEIRDRVQALRCGLDPAEWVGETRPLRCLKLVGRTIDDKGTLPFDVAAAHDLYQTLLAPLETVIGDRHLLVVTHGALSTLPFQVLLTKRVTGEQAATLKAAPWLVRRQAVSMMPSVAGLQALRQAARPSSAKKRYLAVANPLLTGREGADRRAFEIQACRHTPLRQRMLVALGRIMGGDGVVVRGGVADVASVRRLEPLPDTADEVCAVGHSLGAPRGAILLGEDASERALREMDVTAELADYKVLHFATHGLVSGEIKGLGEPALVLSPPSQGSTDDDGLLTASEVASLKLDADWVILSACNTAAGQSLDDEALSGLARSFFYAGARSLLVSHWPVQSHAAVRLTTFALRGMKRQPGLGRAEALRQAMLDMLDKPKWASDLHPHAWAPFIVVGEAGGDAWKRPRARLPILPEKAAPPKPSITRGPQADWRGRVFGSDP